MMRLVALIVLASCVDSGPGPTGKKIDAIYARKLDIDLAHAPAPKGTVYISRAIGPITIDGVGTDVGWSGIQQAELVTAEGGADPVGKATAKLTWDDDNLYAFVSVTDSD